MDYSTKMGVLWKKSNERGEYMTGYVEIDGERYNVVLFPNRKRPDKNDPDWQIFPSEPRERRQEAEPMDEESIIPF